MATILRPAFDTPKTKPSKPAKAKPKARKPKAAPKPLAERVKPVPPGEPITQKPCPRFYQIQCRYPDGTVLITDYCTDEDDARSTMAVRERYDEGDSPSYAMVELEPPRVKREPFLAWSDLKDAKGFSMQMEFADGAEERLVAALRSAVRQVMRRHGLYCPRFYQVEAGGTFVVGYAGTDFRKAHAWCKEWNANKSADQRDAFVV